MKEEMKPDIVIQQIGMNGGIYVNDHFFVVILNLYLIEPNEVQSF